MLVIFLILRLGQIMLIGKIFFTRSVQTIPKYFLNTYSRLYNGNFPVKQVHAQGH